MADNTQYVKFTEFTLLKQKYDIIKVRNKELNRLIKSMSESIDIIKTTYDSIVSINNSIPKLEDIKTILSKPQLNNNSNNRKEEFETKTDSEIIDHKFFPSTKCNNTSSNNQCNISNVLAITIFKKIEESEIFINEMTRQYNILVLKYKYLQEEKDYINENNKCYNEQINSLKEKIYNNGSLCDTTCSC